MNSCHSRFSSDMLGQKVYLIQKLDCPFAPLSMVHPTPLLLRRATCKTVVIMVTIRPLLVPNDKANFPRTLSRFEDGDSSEKTTEKILHWPKNPYKDGAFNGLRVTFPLCSRGLTAV